MASEVLYYLDDSHQVRAIGRRLLRWMEVEGYLVLCHMRTQTDEDGGFPRPRWLPAHCGAFTIHGIFDEFPELRQVAQHVHPLYKINLYQRIRG